MFIKVRDSPQPAVCLLALACLCVASLTQIPPVADTGSVQWYVIGVELDPAYKVSPKRKPTPQRRSGSFSFYFFYFYF
jgi:hypothetical protein